MHAGQAGEFKPLIDAVRPPCLAVHFLQRYKIRPKALNGMSGAFEIDLFVSSGPDLNVPGHHSDAGWLLCSGHADAQQSGKH